ncbi:MAG: hypothetical protein RLZZ450_429 [Pseudomonadota bacterium]|jgi:hypothetical protein
MGEGGSDRVGAGRAANASGAPRTHAAPGAACARALSVLGTAVLLSLVALFAYAPIFAVDFFWHLELGKLIAAQHTILQVDSFSSVHPERPYVQFQWLWELLVYGVYQLAELRGVRVFQVLMLSGSFVLLERQSGRLLHSRALRFAFCALALVLFEDRFQQRPSATALGFVALMLSMLVDPTQRDRPRAWLFTGVVACLWSNIHSGESLLMVLCFGALAAGSALSFRLGTAPRARARTDARLLLATCVGVLMCPAFIAGLGAFSAAIGPQLATGNKEWRPSYTMLENGWSPSHVLIALGPTAVMVAYALAQHRRMRGQRLTHAPWAEWILCAGLLVLSQHAVRNAFLCLVPLCFLLLPRPLGAPAQPARTPRLIPLLGAALLFVAFYDHVVVGYGGIREAAEIIAEDLAPNAFPEELATFMSEAEIEGGSLNDGRWGGYLIWRLWPRLHVFVDTRQDLTPEQWPIFLASQHAETRPEVMNEAFRRWGLELAIFRGPTFPLLLAPAEWQLLYKAGDQELYQHRAGVHAQQNHDRASRWLDHKAHALHVAADPSSVASEVGATVWLSAPTRVRALAKLSRLRASDKEDDVVEGLSLESQLAFETGRYAAASVSLERLLSVRANDVRALYRLALVSHALGAFDRARAALRQLSARQDQLSVLQKGRLALLERSLAGEARALQRAP